MPATYQRDGAIALIGMDHPPVNALNRAVRAGLKDALAEALADREVRAIVLHGHGSAFSAGADIAEFGTPQAQASPTLPDVIAALDASTKPVIAALHGSALGGGLELALGCHYRVAVAKTRLGLPEVKLGILPGAGGTQRLPRLTGVVAALDIITSGRLAPASQALDLGIIDALDASGSPIDAAKSLAERILARNEALVRVRDRDVPAPPAGGVFDDYRSKLKRQARGQISPLACVDAVEAAVTLPFDEGLKREGQLFEALAAGPQHAALVHVFFGTREVANVPGVARDTEARAVERVAVIGAGTMGGGIAMCFADAGVPVTVVEQSSQALDRGLEAVRKNYAQSVARGRLSAEEAGRRMDLIVPSLALADVAATDLVIEAVFENMAVKKDVFRRIDALARPGAILATNTSYLDVNEIAAVTQRPGDVLGLHFFSPANVMKLLEVVRADRTSAVTLKTALAVGKAIGKVSVVAGVCDGFIGNRMYRAYQRQAFYMLEDGALPGEIDAAMTEFGFAMGPLAVGDLTGQDIDFANRRREDANRASGERYVELPDKLCEMGRLGQKTGAGWYLYRDGNRRPIPDPDIEALIVAESARKGIVRRPIPKDEIRMRELAALVNEGARILAEGIAARPVDIDIVWVNGFGFPAHAGGPMYWADARGLKDVLVAVHVFAKDDPQTWQPAPLLVKLAAGNRTFADWSAARLAGREARASGAPAE